MSNWLATLIADVTIGTAHMSAALEEAIEQNRIAYERLKKTKIKLMEIDKKMTEVLKKIREEEAKKCT